jgi:hypothetical protein
MFPNLSNAKPEGPSSFAEVAAAPSPPKPYSPVPATTETIPVLAVTFKILWFPEEKKRFPAPSRATSSAESVFASVAAI